MATTLITFMAVTCGLLPLQDCGYTLSESCSEPPPLSGAYRIGWNSTTAKYVCLDRHSPIDEFIITCEGSQWTQANRCKVDCGPPTQVDGAAVFVNDTEEGAVAEYLCYDDYNDTLAADPTSTCSPQKGQWSGQGPVCTGPEDLALNKSLTDSNVTDVNIETCTDSESVLITISTDDFYNVHSVILYYNQPVAEVNVTVHWSYPNVKPSICGPLVEGHDGWYVLDCPAKTSRATSIHISTHAGEVALCDVQAYGRMSVADCMGPPVAVGARATYNSTSYMAKAVYSCVSPYVYIGGVNTINCRRGGWSYPKIKCAEMEDFALLGSSDSYDVIDNNHTTCINGGSSVQIRLDRVVEVHVVVVVTDKIIRDEITVEVDKNGQKLCKRQSNGITIGDYKMRAFDCPGFPFGTVIRVVEQEKGSLLSVCEVKVYGRDASSGALECQQTDTGHDYKGSVNFTVDGRPCLFWDHLGPHVDVNITNFPDSSIADLDNRCRNPQPERIAPYCYVSQDVYDYCPVPSCDNVCRQGDGRTYQGRIHETQNDTSCIRWDSNPEQFALNGIMASRSESLCRNPIGSMSQPWCFIGSSSEYGLCDVPFCPVNISVFTVNGTVSDQDLQTECFCWIDDEISDPKFRHPLANASRQCSDEGGSVLLCYTGEEEQKDWVYYILKPLETTTPVQKTVAASTMGNDTTTLEANITTDTITTTAPIQNNNHTTGTTAPTQGNKTHITDTTTPTNDSNTHTTDQAMLRTTSDNTNQTATRTDNNGHHPETTKSTPHQETGSTLETARESTTHVSRTSTKSPNQQNCQCRCKRDLSTGAIAAIMDERKANLTVNPKATTAFIRKKTSAKDRRTTATASGTTCVAVVAVLFSFIFIPDIINLGTFIFKLKK